MKNPTVRKGFLKRNCNVCILDEPVNQYNNLSNDINYTFLLEKEVKSNFNKP